MVVIGLGCAPQSDDSESADPAAVTGEFVTYVADFNDGHSEWWHAVRTADGREVRLDFDTPPGVATGTQVRIHGDDGLGIVGDRMHVRALDVLPRQPIGAAVGEPDTYAAPTTDTYALVLVDLGKGVNVTTAAGQTTLFANGPTDKSFANYYKEVSYGKYQVTGDVIGPFPFSMTTCDTTGMYQAIEPMITGTYNHLIYYFNSSSLCQFGGLGEEGSVTRPAKRTWMNGSLTCVVLMQEPGHNLGLMHANTIKCGPTGASTSFSTAPKTDCTITEYGSGMSTMGGGCKQFNAYERWYMQWLSGCNGVRVPSTGTFNLQPLENNCSGGSGIQVLQVPFPATLPVSDPQSTTTTVNLNDYYVELRTSGGIFDAYSTSTRGTVFSGPTVFVYVSDNVRPPAATGRGQNSVWTELLNMTPSGSAYTGLTTAGQSFVDPAGGPTIKLESISATGATVSVTYPNGGTGSPTCIDGTALTAPGPAPGSCTGSAPATGTGGTTGGGGARSTGTGGTTTATGMAGRPGMVASGGTTGRSGTGGATATGGTTGVTGSGGVRGTGGNSTGGTTSGSASGGTTGLTGSGGAAGGGTPGETLTGGCACSTDPGHPGPRTAVWLSLAVGLALARVRRRNQRRAV
ncbi:MAG TPA: MYXO-CTERM sorting domain-containing protein [Polyangia bacterium]|nr:MYXO-CTERM sorting domain-containing protein [Polyangia bacterium]